MPPERGAECPEWAPRDLSLSPQRAGPGCRLGERGPTTKCERQWAHSHSSASTTCGRSQARHCRRHYEQTKMSTGTDLGSAGGERHQGKSKRHRTSDGEQGWGETGVGRTAAGTTCFTRGGTGGLTEEVTLGRDWARRGTRGAGDEQGQRPGASVRLACVRTGGPCAAAEPGAARQGARRPPWWVRGEAVTSLPEQQRRGPHTPKRHSGLLC